jgi:CubicO group peptidase (beta-lactamase class C family)
MPVPSYMDKFLPLIRARLGAGATIGTGIDTISIENLLLHQTDLNRNPSAALNPPAPTEPAGGLATFDYWTWVKLLISEPGGPAGLPPAANGSRYHNNNFNILTTVIEACTDATFNEYVMRRLFLDARFNRVSRRVVEARLGALYYGGTSPNWTGGVKFSDYSNWSGNGGFYATANQLTDWLHALYTRQSVARVEGSAPLISSTGISNLFGTTGYFCIRNVTRSDGPAASQKRYQENGGTGVGGGFMGGNLAIVETPTGAIHTVLFVANGNLGAPGADTPFIAAIGALPWV